MKRNEELKLRILAQEILRQHAEAIALLREWPNRVELYKGSDPTSDKFRCRDCGMSAWTKDKVMHKRDCPVQKVNRFLAMFERITHEQNVETDDV